ncbi:hypothetical protein RN001_007648 [Aquatica leii]|uniref:Sodium channel protein Nach n=1 Tax=Aquatica leii TaxID=1421715 RepID=A0AAN7PYC7_9COLE|nr:hypothetical protein RN001_007648 [Aquatica leii]
MNDQNVTRIWYTINVVLGIMSVIMICEISLEIYKTPIEIVMQSFTHPICNFSFPAVAICNTNKFSKKRITHYASEISVKSNVSLENVIRYLSALGDLHDNVYDKNKNYAYIQTLIEKFGSNNFSTNTLFYILNILSTPCDELLINCVWKQQIHKCSKIFQWRFLDLGFCCVFNYHRKSFYNTFQVKDERQCISGWEEGLQVTIYNDVDDYFYNPTFELGATVQIFNPADYPDITSGNLLLQLLQVGTIAFFSLEPRKFYSVDEIRKYPVHLRNCMFHDERLTVFGNYSYSNCLVECRMASIFALCECIPFFMPYERNHSCTLSNIRCLSKYQDKWRNLYPFGFHSDELDKEKENSLDCEYCYSDCTTVNYHLRFSSVPFNAHHKDIMKLNRYNVIHVYYERSRAKLYKQDVVYYWYEAISNLGGIVGIFLGFSFISVIEMLQSIGRKIVHSIRNLSKSTS